MTEVKGESEAVVDLPLIGDKRNLNLGKLMLGCSRNRALRAVRARFREAGDSQHQEQPDNYLNTESYCRVL